MSNTAYPAKIRRVNTVEKNAGVVDNEPDISELEDDDYIDDAYDEQVAPAGLFGSRGRAIALGGSVLLLLLIFGAAFWLLGSGTSSTHRVVGIRVGNIAPNFELVDVHTNKPVQLASLRDKPVIVNFWGTWCPPCRAEMPEMQKFYDKHKNDIHMVGVSMGPRDEAAGVKTFVDAARYGWTFIHDAQYDVATSYQVSAVPSSYIIGTDGVIRAIKIGPMDVNLMEAFLKQAKQ